MSTVRPGSTWSSLAALVSALALGACAPANPVGAPPVHAPHVPVTPVESPVPTPTPSPKRLMLDFEKSPLGQPPAEFIDVKDEEATPDWVYRGDWQVVEDEKGNRVLMHDDVRQQPAVSFQRYRGTALGTANGQVPEVYYSEVDMKPISSPHNYTPTGDQGAQFYYVRYNTYLEVIIKPDLIEIWEAKEAAPNTSKGWKRLWFRSLKTEAKTTRRIGALVDTREGTFTAYLDGEPLETVKSDLLKPEQPAWVALRGIGNVVRFDNLLIEPR
ncbi:MAG: hypothetical protein ACLGIN_00190 [Candidatus Sericytochromatia bacterium]